MIRKITAEYQGEGYSLRYGPEPDSCPHCHSAVAPIKIGNGYLTYPKDDSETVLEVVFKCPRHLCRRLFVARFVPREFSEDRGGKAFLLEDVLPRSFNPVPVRENIANVSSKFVEIYQQAAQAEAEGLDEIAGLGYRKALEFLIKDYCIQLAPDEEESIKAETLGRTISSRIDDERIRECARRAAWLGNDEAHYVRKWSGKDIKDLKTLIDLTENWIDNCLLTEQYRNSME